jgi:hypothetical protein
MKTELVNINFPIMATAVLEHVKMKATAAGSTIIYRENGILVAETPKNKQKVKLIVK